MLFEIKEKESPFNGLWLFEKAYSLSDNAFTEELKRAVLKQTGLKYGSLPDWWVSAKGDNPKYSWKGLIELALKILNSDATETFVHTLWLPEIPKFEIKDMEPSELPRHSVSGSKRVNASAENWHNNRVTMDSKFRLYGSESGTCVEGTWLHWVTFACNILSSENTKICCPELYCPELKIEF